jgi:predicted RNA-binding Zn-ribbon protein involved in translation (DUF1610 family)
MKIDTPDGMKTDTPCPRCGRMAMRPDQPLNALSRKDNKTYVCTSCGNDEAMANMMGGRDAGPATPA